MRHCSRCGFAVTGLTCTPCAAADEARVRSQGPQVVSQACWLAWARTDRAGLESFCQRHGKLRVRVAVERQRWPEGTMARG